MSDTWQRRTDHRGSRTGRGKSYRSLIRACCDTVSREPHAATCQRPEAMCGDKAGFESRSGAARRAAVIVEQTGRPRRSYRCPYCDLWHLTTQEEI